MGGIKVGWELRRKGSQSSLTIRNAVSYAGSIAGAYAAVPTATFIGATESSRSIGSSTESTRSTATGLPPNLGCCGPTNASHNNLFGGH